ncbi:WD40 repeat-like protein [Aaosphaeria arxii CBS 175.79]|uniref:WD40 repeat-like protein n=1 Tax=Aaosphaeria arxii CBS 175.79 TaxID=1450172 RepID=A0A6A5YBY9_9PLEO|nr:WD40 repeat-like protein [Aaosphaeria arxii CBS 175.79]KAF2022144.1 WD40 repeat-like protein [Aaosphaeria arxii CBS 175.79]
MRLLECVGDEFTLKDFRSSDIIPPYAILSHTWIPNEEVTLQELQNSTRKRKRTIKSGFEKLEFCRQQAKNDGLQYYWVDTCCIDKTDKAELSYAINSMFRWYQDAARCYVYLPDVSSPLQNSSADSSSTPWEPDFQKSKWFTRGWTLQELLAPDSVEFFSREGRRLGDKGSLMHQIRRITGIPKAALQGAPLTQFTVDERLSWIETRQTTFEEDRAYSLIGIVNVNVPPIYGEGLTSAFKRLMDEVRKRDGCIHDLRATDPRDDKKRIEDTKGGLLQDSYRWVFENSEFKQWRDSKESQLLWIKGDPGKGKTMLLCGILDDLRNQSLAKKDLLSYFFCQATDARINNATAVLRGLLYLLVDQQPSLVAHIRKKHDHAGKALFEDANAWTAMSEIFASVLQDPNLAIKYLAVDALDECVVGLPKLLDFIVEQSSASPRVKWIVSSRNWPDIEERLAKAGGRARLSLELNADSVSAAVDIFIQQKVVQLARDKKYDKKTTQAVHHHLTSNAKGTFLWVALVYQNLRDVPKRHVMKRLSAFPPGLDTLYEQMIQQINSSDDADVCKEILALAATVYRPTTLAELVALTEQLEDVADDHEAIQEIIGHCGSFLTLRENTVYFVHQSAKDFLLAQARGHIFPSGQEDIHHVLFSKSLEAMSTTLKRDMYNLRAPGYLIDQVEPPEPDPLASSRYSCIYWIDHLCSWQDISPAADRAAIQIGGSVYEFLKQKYLYWLEALSLCKSMPKGLVLMAKLERLIYNRTDPLSAVLLVVKDARRFIMTHKGAIENAPLQTYVSALVFSPSESLIRKLSKHENPGWLSIKPAVAENWGPCLQTLEGHTGYVTSVAVSHNLVASGSNDGTIKIWEVSSGECLQTLKGNSGLILSIAFSHGLIASVSAADSTVKIWKASSGECLQTLKGHSDDVLSVAFSDNLIASGSNDGTIKTWEATSGECLRTLIDHNGPVHALAFSHNLIASKSGYSKIKIWETNSGKCLHTLRDDFTPVSSVAFSHCSTYIAAGSENGIIVIWETSSGKCLQMLKGHDDYISSVAFSHCSTYIVSGLESGSVGIWEARSGTCIQTLKGHGDDVLSVAFSQNLDYIASGSADSTIKIWEIRGIRNDSVSHNSSKCLQTLTDHRRVVLSIAFSHDSAYIASGSGSGDCTIKIWEVGSSRCLQTLEGHSSSVGSIVFSHDSAYIASGSDDNTVKVWKFNSSSSDCVQTLEGHINTIYSLAFSHDSAYIASGSSDGRIKIWEVGNSSNDCVLTIKTRKIVSSLAFSHNSAYIASGLFDGTIKIWEVGSSSDDCTQTLNGHSGCVESVAFSHNSAYLVSGSLDKTVKVWDASSGECLQTLEIDQYLYPISFNSTGDRLRPDIGDLVIGSSTSPSRTTAITKLQPGKPRCIGLSPDKKWITYKSERILWLPTEYRPWICDVSGKVIAMGTREGRVWTCEVDL